MVSLLKLAEITEVRLKIIIIFLFSTYLFTYNSMLTIYTQIYLIDLTFCQFIKII